MTIKITTDVSFVAVIRRVHAHQGPAIAVSVERKRPRRRICLESTHGPTGA